MDCVFCAIARGQLRAEPIAESERFMAFKDMKPICEGHTLIVPKQHFGTLLDLPDSWGQELLKFTKQVGDYLLEQKLGDGFNVIMNTLPAAGQVVPHAHLHIIPRNEGDGIRFFVKK